MLVPHVDRVREKSVNGRLPVRAVSSGCNFLWSRHQHGGNNGSMNSGPWQLSVNVMDECVVVFNGTSRNGLTIGTRVVDMGNGRGTNTTNNNNNTRIEADTTSSIATSSAVHTMLTSIRRSSSNSR